MKRTLSTAFAVLATAVLALTACSTAPVKEEAEVSADLLGPKEVQDAMADLYEKAVADGETSVVAYGPGQAVYQPGYEAFHRRYPTIQITGEYITGAKLGTRLDQEFSSGQRVGAVQVAGAALTSVASKAERCEKWEPFDSSKMRYYMDQSVDPGGTYRAVIGYPFGIAYNTDILGDSPPKGWADLTDPKWSGKFVMEDPRMVNGMSQTMAQLMEAGVFDRTWLEGIYKNKPEIRASSSLTVQEVSNGLVAFDPFGAYVQYLPAISSGESLGFVFPTEGAARMEYHYACLLKDAPNPSAAKLFMNWLFTPEGQQVMSDAGVYGLHEAVKPPQGLPELDEVKDKLIPALPVDRTSELTQQTIGIAKEIFG